MIVKCSLTQDGTELTMFSRGHATFDAVTESVDKWLMTQQTWWAAAEPTDEVVVGDWLVGPGSSGGRMCC